MNSLADDIRALSRALIWYSKRKIKYFAHKFEELKNFWVEVLMSGRGIHQKRFWHTSMIALGLAGILTSGIFGGGSIISSSYPGVGGPDPRFISAFEPHPAGIVLEGFGDTQTIISQKPRSEIEDYTVKDGDTLSSIAKDKGVSIETIRWANNLTSDAIKPDQTLKILPVTGVSHTVKSGETLESVAKKYSAEAQAIMDFPFNDVPDDFKLRVGQLLIVPDGSPPEAAAPKVRAQPQYLTKGPASPAFDAPFGASFIWPAGGSITQYYAWYHPGVDIANRAAPGIAASDGGTVVVAGWPDGYGYGNRVVIDHGNGYRSLYAHLSNIYVSVGEKVSRGQLVGQMGSTGRSTGTHLHLEIHYKGIPVNPLAILK
ncbi:M23 family metallopeptidase [Candidatus Daviesbacteria bacterium]|nr:M23 family metallopeptidase [Candidatus Daviesbacteria bacterium]